MAVAVVVDKMSVYGDRRAHLCTLTFSGNYPNEGEAVTAASFGLQGGVINAVMFDGPAVAADGETATPVKYIATSDGGGALVVYEGSAAGTALTEKGAEAYEAGSNVRALVIGY